MFLLTNLWHSVFKGPGSIPIESLGHTVANGEEEFLSFPTPPAPEFQEHRTETDLRPLTPQGKAPQLIPCTSRSVHGCGETAGQSHGSSPLLARPIPGPGLREVSSSVVFTTPPPPKSKAVNHRLVGVPAHKYGGTVQAARCTVGKRSQSTLNAPDKENITHN